MATEVDAALVRYFNQEFLAGLPAGRGETTLAAVCHRFSEFGKFGDLHLPRSHRALKGWRRRAPARSRDPHAWPIWCLLIWDLCRRGFWRMGLYLLWLVTC